MSVPPRVSVVIAAYNHAAYVAEAVESAWAQTSGRPQVVVVNDGSTDDTAEVLAGLDVEVVTRANGGLSAARNSGLQHARGDYVVFLDADDRLDPRHNEACLAALATHPEATYAYTQWQCFGLSDHRSEFPPFSRTALLEQNFIHAAALVPTALARSTGFDERLRWGLEDWDLWLTLLGDGHVGVLVDEPLLHYRQSGTGMTALHRSRPVKLTGVHLWLLLKHRRLYGLRPFLRRLVTLLRRMGRDVARALRRR